MRSPSLSNITVCTQSIRYLLSALKLKMNCSRQKNAIRPAPADAASVSPGIAMGATRRYASHKPEPQELVHAGRKRWVDNHATPTSSRNRHISASGHGLRPPSLCSAMVSSVLCQQMTSCASFELDTHGLPRWAGRCCEIVKCMDAQLRLAWGPHP